MFGRSRVIEPKLLAEATSGDSGLQEHHQAAHGESNQHTTVGPISQIHESSLALSAPPDSVQSEQDAAIDSAQGSRRHSSADSLMSASSGSVDSVHTSDIESEDEANFIEEEFLRFEHEDPLEVSHTDSQQSRQVYGGSMAACRTVDSVLSSDNFTALIGGSEKCAIQLFASLITNFRTVM